MQRVNLVGYRLATSLFKSVVLFFNIYFFAVLRIEVAGILKQMRIENIKHKYEAEEQAAHQHFKVGLALSGDEVKGRIY